jgi:tRNA threonylcarbamoyladenosine biosynthesis protein TsaB
MSPLILYIETSGDVCSICLAAGDKILGIKETDTPNSHAASVAVFLDQLLKENQLTVNNLAAVCISKGPGSYTGLRIGTSLAKAICYAGNIPLIAVSTLEAMCNGVKNQAKEASLLFCPMIDARRMEVYTAVYDFQSNNLLPEQPMILNENSFEGFDFKRMVFFGSGADKFKNIHADIRIEPFRLSASHLLSLGLKRFEQSLHDDVAYFEPNYLKPFYSPATFK